MVTKFGGQILATKFGFVPDWLCLISRGDDPNTGAIHKQFS